METAKMPDDKTLIAVLESRLEQKRASMSVLAREVAALEDGLEKVRLGLGLGLSHPALPLTVPTPRSVVHDLPDIPARAFRHLRLQAAILGALEIMGRLQGTGDIVRTLDTGGFQSTTQDIPKAVSQSLVRMWKDGKVQRTTENLWGLPNWEKVPNPMPMNGYVAA